MGCNCGKYQEGGTIEKTRTFNEFEYNKLVDREKKEFFGYWSGYLWDITHKSSSDIVGKFNPKTKILYIFGNSDLNNPLVKWLQDNSKISREEYEKLENGGRLNSETLDLIETLQPLADSGDENAIKLIESLRGSSKIENKYEFVYSVTAIRDNGVNKILEDVLVENENTNKDFSIDYERKYKLIDRGFNKAKLRVTVLINGDKLDSYVNVFHDFRTSLPIHDLTEINSIIKNLFFIHSIQRKDFSRYLLNNEYLFTENVNDSLNKIESDLKNRKDRYDVNSYVVKVKDATIIETKNFTKQDYEPFYYAKIDNKKRLIIIFEPNPNNPFDRDDKTLFKEITFKDLNKYTRNQLDLPNAQKRYVYLNKLPVIKNELKDKFSKDIPIGQQLRVYLDQEYQKNYETVYSSGGSIKYANGGGVGDKVLLSVGSHRAREKMNKAGISYVEKYGLETDTFGKHYYEINKKDLKKSLNITGIKVANPKGKLGTAVKPNYAKGGHITSEISKCELEDMVGKKLDGWNDDIIYYGGKKYEKCFLRPYYKVK
jgi:hypothetical protein